MDVCKRIEPEWHGGTLNIRGHKSSGVVDGRVQSVLPKNCNDTEPNCTVTCVVQKAVVTVDAKLAPRSDGIRNSREIQISQSTRLCADHFK
ncbi:hypothetical protein TNCV_3314921 [Trichonephila clavipes]|nr:hypothetical protein TNCV_3314921 [Trichonephila clavipes]